MKKIIITALISFITLPVFAAEQVEDMFKDLKNAQQTFFQSSIVPTDPDVTVENKEEISPKHEDTERYVDHMPFFKKVRLRIQNSVRALTPPG